MFVIYTFTLFVITSHICTHNLSLSLSLQHLPSESLKQYCIEAIELLERQAGDSIGGERGLQVSSELEKLHKDILQCAGELVTD